MAKYRVLQKSFINNALVEEGQVIEFDGEPSSHLELIEEDESESKPKGKGKKGAAASDESQEQAGE